VKDTNEEMCRERGWSLPPRYTTLQDPAPAELSRCSPEPCSFGFCGSFITGMTDYTTGHGVILSLSKD
jgi:hypothetical protein